VVGLGEIGRATARRARAFGMRIAYSGRGRAPAAVEAELGGAAHVPLDELLATADVVSLHCPLSAATHHLIDARRLALMRPGSYLVNTARGPIVDEAALAAALRSGRPAGAGLDVYEREPEVHPGLLAMAQLAARNALAVAAGGAPLTPVNDLATAVA
jgi:glyoxylate reductase